MRLIDIRGAVIVVAMIGSAIAIPAPNSPAGMLQLMLGAMIVVASLAVNMFANPAEYPRQISKEKSK